MYELRCEFVMVTETWFKGSRKLNAELEDIKSATGIRLLCRHRPVRGSRGVVGGGVAIAFNNTRCSLKRKMLKTEHDTICAVGKIAKIERQFAIFSVYVLPATKSKDFLQLCEDLAAALNDVRVSLRDPIIVIGGDFNNRDPSAAFEAIDGIRVLDSGPTRGNATLDLIFTNACDSLMGGRAQVFPPA